MKNPDIKIGDIEAGQGIEDALEKTLRARFEANMHRHVGIEWTKVWEKISSDAEKIRSLVEMEKTGGEPDVLQFDPQTGLYTFFDCSAESPIGRRNCVYDGEAELYLKQNFPAQTYSGNAVDMARAMGIGFLDKKQYRKVLQKSGLVDKNSSSWLYSPADIRNQTLAYVGFCLNDDVLVYESHAPHTVYSRRGFRGYLAV